MDKQEEFIVQELQYQFPYHYLVNFDNFKSFKNLNWGIEYYAYIQYIKETISGLEYQNLLDIGCGDGKLISILSKKNKDKKYLGYDLSEPAILLAKGLNYNNKNAQFICGDFKNTDLTFDIVTLIEVLEHIPDIQIDSFVEGVYSKVKSGGYLIVSLPSKNIFPVKKKHYRHYTLGMILHSFSLLKLIDKKFLVKNNFLFKANTFFSTLLPYSFFNKIQLKIAKLTLFNAKETNCRHIVCVFQKD